MIMSWLGKKTRTHTHNTDFITHRYLFHHTAYKPYIIIVVMWSLYIYYILKQNEVGQTIIVVLNTNMIIVHVRYVPAHQLIAREGKNKEKQQNLKTTTIKGIMVRTDSNISA